MKTAITEREEGKMKPFRATFTPIKRNPKTHELVSFCFGI